MTKQIHAALNVLNSVKCPLMVLLWLTTLEMAVSQRRGCSNRHSNAEIIAVQREEGGIHCANTGQAHREKSPSRDSPHSLGFGSWDALKQCKVPVPRDWTYWVKGCVLVCVISGPLNAPSPPPGGGWIISLSQEFTPKHRGFWLCSTFAASCEGSLGSPCPQPLGPQQICLFKGPLLHLILFFVIMKLQVQSEIFWVAHIFLYYRPVFLMYFLPHSMAAPHLWLQTSGAIEQFCTAPFICSMPKQCENVFFYSSPYLLFHFTL